MKHNRPVDMSLPASRRRRKAKGGKAKNPVPAQLQHGNSPKGKRLAKEGEKKMERDRKKG